jgi:hypothetical protein
MQAPQPARRQKICSLSIPSFRAKERLYFSAVLALPESGKSRERPIARRWEEKYDDCGKWDYG